MNDHGNTNGNASLRPSDEEASRPVGSYPPSGVDVLVVGAGLAGLTAAMECVRKGHSVRMLERNDSINTAGDMYFMGLSATRFLKHWPTMAREYDEISLHDAWIETFKHSGEQIIAPLPVAKRLAAQGLDPANPPGTFQIRPLVYKMFVRQVERLGVEIHFNAKVAEYAETQDAAEVTLADGRKFRATLVIAADGVGSHSQALLGRPVRAASSGRAMWRAAFPMSHLDKSPAAKELFATKSPGGEPVVRTFLGPGTYGLTLSRPETMVWIVNRALDSSNSTSTSTSTSGGAAESWHNSASAERVLAEIDASVPGGVPWSPVFKELIGCTPPGHLINFELLWRDPQPAWTWASPAGHVVQIGDAAHSFLPASGNGATQAIEDAVSLAACLQLAGGRAHVKEAVRVHLYLRFVRVTCAQKLGFANAELLQQTDWAKVRLDPRIAAPRLPRWVWAHDPEAYAVENYAKGVESLKRAAASAGKEEVDITRDTTIPPNYPPGYRYEPWDMDTILAQWEAGQSVDLGAGDWD